MTRMVNVRRTLVQTYSIPMDAYGECVSDSEIEEIEQQLGASEVLGFIDFSDAYDGLSISSVEVEITQAEVLP